ncbi:MAG: alpha/beta fold hydrolase [Acidimicrobiia bacterium]|nr:alpha/beta fold hydrolase [Acidimicrobiia bacterium]MDH5520242.1 alpha/beta fold hydrolase [Acidimicrobiia bacterium]
MKPSTDRLFRPGRIIALAVIGLVVVGLAYLGFAAGDEPMAVPEGAEAGDLTLEPCMFEAENGAVPADCGTLVVPENRTDPRSRLIALPVVRVRSQTEQPDEPVFYLEGGPGVTNVDYLRASRFTANRDLVMVGYRGVDGSVHLDCPEVDDALGHSTDLLGEETYGAVADAFRACADRLTGDGIDLAGYGLVDQVDDLETARAALGYDRINLLSESAGTRTAMIYSWRHPERIHRSVMIGVNPPGHYFWYDGDTDRLIGRYAELCAEDGDCRRRTDDLAATMLAVSADMPDRWLFLPIDEDTVRAFSLFGIMESTTKAGVLNGGGAPYTIDAWLSAGEGDPSGLWFFSAFPDFMGEVPWIWGQRAAAARLDVEAANDYFSSDWQVGELNVASSASAYTWIGGSLGDAWPAVNGEDEYRQVQTSDVDTLLISGELDGTTPPEPAAEELLPHLPNGHQVVLPGIGHTVSFYREQPEAGTHLINTYFDTGEVDDSQYTTQLVDFTPDTTIGTFAKRLVAMMIGLALLAIVILVAMAGWVYRAGAFGPVASAALRSLSPLVLGVGGWFLGALIVLAFTDGVPITGPLVVVLSVAVPIWLGLYLAWVKRRWATETKITGLAVAAGGTLLGAWLGFGAGGWLFSIITSMLGAAAFGNLALIVLDLAWDRQRRRRILGADSGAIPVPSPADPRTRVDVSLRGHSG